MPSARWAISCHNCNKAFTHSQIAEPHRITDYLALPSKPEFPLAGQELECPHCKSKAMYQRTDLWYQAAVNGAL
jgi:DNA-directed RNA polymerase subunit RPC12/RpoP